MERARSNTVLDKQKIDTLAVALGAVLVDKIAPEERGDYGLLVAEYRQETSRRTGDDHPLAYGMGELVQFASPYIYEGAKIAVLYLVAELGISAKSLASGVIKAGEEALRERVSSWVKESLSRSGPNALSTEQRSAMLVSMEKHLTTLKVNRKIKQSIIHEIQRLSVTQ
jgi:hypothetical protein